MFPARFFPTRFFAPTYFPKVGAEAPPEDAFISGPFPLFTPRRVIETLSNDERARLLTAILAALE